MAIETKGHFALSFTVNKGLGHLNCTNAAEFWLGVFA